MAANDAKQRKRLRARGALLGIPGLVLMATGGFASGLASPIRVAALLVGIAFLVVGLAMQAKGARL